MPARLKGLQMPDASVLYDQRDAIAILTLNRPQRANAMNRDMLKALGAALDRAEQDPAVRAIVLTGAGNAFCSGFDLKEQAQSPPAGRDGWRLALQQDFDAVIRFWRSPKPTVAAVRGPALAGGCELAVACDITIAAEDARFGEPELKFGAGIVVMLLPWLTGPKQAKEILLTGNDRITAARALELGLVNRLVPVGQELDEALVVAGELAAMDPRALALTKRAINRSYDIMGMDEALRAALDLDLAIEGPGTDHKRQFLTLVREQGMAAALTWRDGRLDGE